MRNINLFGSLESADKKNEFDAVRLTLASPEKIRAWSFGEVKRARNHQLSHLPPGSGRAVLRENFRPDQGLRMPVRQIQADEIPRRDLCEKCGVEVTARQGAARAHGACQFGLSGGAHFVFQGAALAHRPGA